jgi:hypothetical protein
MGQGRALHNPLYLLLEREVTAGRGRPGPTLIHLNSPLLRQHGQMWTLMYVAMVSRRDERESQDPTISLVSSAEPLRYSRMEVTSPRFPFSLTFWPFEYTSNLAVTYRNL